MLASLGSLGWVAKAGEGLAGRRLVLLEVEGVAGTLHWRGYPVGVAASGRLAQPCIATSQPLILQAKNLSVQETLFSSD